MNADERGAVPVLPKCMDSTHRSITPKTTQFVDELLTQLARVPFYRRAACNRVNTVSESAYPLATKITEAPSLTTRLGN